MMKMTYNLLFFVALAAVVNANYCNWDGCNGAPQGCCEESNLLYCNANQNQCESSCGGGWCTNSFSYCTWSTCDGVIRSTEWCNEAQGNCEGACGGMWCTNGGGGGSNPTTPAPVPAPVTPSPMAPTVPNSGTATTTRYWDCSGGACGCAYLPFAGDSNQPAHCHSNSMFAAPAGNAYGAKYYGTAAVSPELFGYDKTWLGDGCGKCWRVTGTSNIPNYDTTTETTLVLKGVNLCPPGNPACSGNNVHFDIAAPGFDVTQYSFAHTCPVREAAEDAGFSACEYWMINSNNPNENCDCSLFNDPVLEAGCNNFKGLHWDNPTVTYESVPCPMELDRLNCWEDNGFNYPNGIPEFCASNVDSSSPVTPSTPAPVTQSPVTQSPTPPPPTTLSPVTNPITPSPITPSPITPSPTPPPPTTPAPVTTPPTSTFNTLGCCTNNMKNCVTWCGSGPKTESDCATCSSSPLFWIPEARTGCLARWDACTNNINGCCDGLSCVGGQYYKQCKHE